MKSLFETGFGMGFHNNFGRPAMGQEPETLPPESVTNPAYTPPTTIPTPTPAQPAPCPTGQTRQADGTCAAGTDWGKLIAQGITGGFGAVTAYEKEKAAQVAKETEKLKQQAKPGMPGYVPPAPGTSPILIAGLVGVGVIALGAVIMVAARG